MPKNRTAYKNKYNLENYERVNLTFPKGEKEQYQQHAEKRGESLNAFIRRAIARQIEEDNRTGADAEE